MYFIKFHRVVVWSSTGGVHFKCKAVFSSQEEAFKKGLTLDALVYELTKLRVISWKALKRRSQLGHISVDDEKP
jgi:hypothetical protein